LQEAVDCLLADIRDSEAIRKAAEEVDARREEFPQRIGEINVAIELTGHDE